MKNINPNPFTTRPEIEGTFGVVTSTHWIATAVGMAMLEKGGNAFDAAVATAFTLQVVEPHLNGPGGDVPVILNDVRTGKTEVICGQGPAPAKATIAHYRSLGLDMVPGTGLLAACVPGMFDTWMLLLRDYGTMRLADVLAPAIYYAQPRPSPGRARARHHRDGRGAVPQILADIGGGLSARRQGAGDGHVVHQPDAGRDLHARAARGEERGRRPRARDRGRAQDLVAGFRRRGDRPLLPHAGGDGHQRDGAPRRAHRRRHGALARPYRGAAHLRLRPLHRVQARAVGAGAGDAAAACAAERASISTASTRPSADFVHLLVECSKLAYADRETFYGDPDFVEVPMATLLSDAYNDERRKLVGDKASLELRPGSVEGFGAVVKLRREEGQRRAVGGMGAGEPTVGRIGEVRGDTVHFDIVDQAGNMVSATPSGGWLQSSPVIPELGFCLGTRAQMFWLEEGHPAALAPGKRPRTTLSPTLALRDGESYLAWGSPGGDQQDQWTTQLFMRHVHAGMNLQEAIDAPAWHSEHFPISFWPRTARPGVLVVERRLPESTVTELDRRGHIVEVDADWCEGRLTAASRDGRRRRAAANPRGMQAYAAGR